MRLSGPSLTSMLATAAMLAFTPTASAQQTPTPSDASGATEGSPSATDDAARNRTLNGHTFLPSFLVGNPFPGTSFGSNTGLGFARLAASANTTGSALNFGALSLGFDAQFGIADWLAIRGSITGTALSGIDLNSALNFGANVSYSGAAGVTFSVAYQNWLRMGFALDAQYNPDYQLSPATIINNVANSLLTPQARLNFSSFIDNHQLLNVGGSWQIAVSPGKAFGLYTDLRYTQAFEKRNDVATNSGAFSAGFALSLDLNAVTPFPIGILGAYRVSSPASGSSPTQDVSAGLFYSGRRNFVLGPEVQITLLPGSTPTNFLLVQGVIVLRYYW